MSDSTLSTDQWGTEIWRNSKGELHRTGGPAVETTNGHKSWYQNGQLHRTNGPAIEYQNGNTSWWVNGESIGINDKGFWKLWDRLTPEQKQDPVLLFYLPGE